MASTLINVALSTIRPAHASYYGDIDESNPVICAAEKEIKGVLAYFAQRTTSPKGDTEACSRGSNWLFNTWNKFEPRLPLDHFYSKLISVGDFLLEHGFYDVANFQCFSRYIETRYKQHPAGHVADAASYRKVFFDEEQTQQESILTAKAILGIYMCQYKSLYVLDPNLQLPNSVEKVQQILKGLRTFMQCLLSNETLFWILYNCTIIMYQICRNLMTTGNSIKAIEFLLWAAVTMETSVPLLGVKYLTWRVTMYSAVCLAYYDCKSGHHAEAFARRALGKLQELSELERLSDSSESVSTQLTFRQATAKMASMVFKRSVYESRRKPKGILRPKVKNNLKEAAQLTWPRTVTEKLLSEMFEGGAAQFLAIVEALSDPHRRTLQIGPSSTDFDMNDVTAELFFAGKEIIAGGGGITSHVASGADHSVLAGVRHDKSMIQLAAAGEDGVTLIAVVRFIKLAFCYEQWATFNTLLDCALIYIKKSGEGASSGGGVGGASGGSVEYSGTELCLALLLVMERLVHSRSQKRLQTTTSGSVFPSGADETFESSAPAPPPTQGGSVHSVQISDDLVNMAETVFYCVNQPTLFAAQGLDGDVLIDRDMVVDACLLLWQKCKLAFGKFTSGSKTDMGSILFRTGSPGKWVHILSIVHASLMWAGIGSVDPELMVEVTLRLALSLEALAGSESANYSDDLGNMSRHSMYSTTQMSPASQLGSALQLLRDGLDCVAFGRSNMAADDARSVADISWMPADEQVMDHMTSTSEALIRDLHVELLTVHHRVALKVLDFNLSQSVEKEFNSSSRAPSTVALKSITQENLKQYVGGSLVSKAIMYMQEADQLSAGDPKALKLLNKAVATIQHAQTDEKRLFEDSWIRLNRSEDEETYSPTPPPPILLSRSNHSMTFKPAYFKPDTAKVAWYRIFGRLAAGPNVKLRLNDYFLPGTGEEVPAGNNCVLRVDGLEPNQRYLFAVAAYTSDGKLIGASVGDSGRSIVACQPLSILATWGFLAQVSYKLGCIEVSRRACAVLWDHFIESHEGNTAGSWNSVARQDFALTTYHLDQAVALASSPVLLRHALTSVFVGVEAAVRDGEIYCDKLCNEGPLMPSQIERLKQCERMLVAMEIAGWLNDISMLLQAAVQTYGLIAPIIQADVSSIPVLQVASKCHSALQEVGGILKVKRSSITQPLHHMVAVLTHYIAKVTKAHGKINAALAAIESGKQILRMEGGPTRTGDGSEEQTSAKRSKSRKGAGAVPDVVSNEELAALEERLAEISRDTRAAGELTGFEDATQVLSRISRMKPIVAYRELNKFRRRSRYLEFFVYVLKKALRLQQIDLAIDWSRDVLSTLHRRNEQYAVNRALVSKQPGGIAVQGDEAKKYAAAVVEFSQEPAKKNAKKQKDKQKKLAMLRKRSGGVPGSEEVEERELRALGILEQSFVEAFRNSVKRKKLRKISAEEMPWRAEFNHLVALLHYDVFLEMVRGKSRTKGGKTPPSRTAEFLDQDWWSYDSSGALVVGWNDMPRPPSAFNVDGRHEVARALERAAHLAISSSLVAAPVPPPAANPTPGELDDARPDSGISQQSNSDSLLSSQEPDEDAQPSETMESLMSSMLSFRRGLVLAHRGQHWTLMQNLSRSLVSCVMSVLVTMPDLTDTGVTPQKVRGLMWRPVSMAADFLLDMLVSMQERSDGSAIWPVDSFAGDMTSVSGGASLKFEARLDDVSLTDVSLVKRVVFQAIQMLYFEERWEQLIDLSLRFSALTHDRYCDVMTPILAHAQYRLRERVQNCGGERHPQPHFSGAAQMIGKKKVDNRDYLRHQLTVNYTSDASSVGVGGHIDPASHDVYESGRRALALACVPFDSIHSMELLRVSMSKSQYTSRALQHSRRLYSVYLASQHNNFAKSRKASANLESNSSYVEFSTKRLEPHSSTPHDVTTIDFRSSDVIETSATSQLSTVMQSYNRTIELLLSHGQRDLVAQASNELADLYYHQGNKRAAHKWWTMALDQILRCKNSIHNWRQKVKDVEDIPAHFLKMCGIWGCLLAISLSCKIGELTAVNINLKSSCALLSSHLVRSIFRSSLPHPTADHDYASYDIIPSPAEASLQSSPSKTKSPVLKSRVQSGSLVNGIDIFSDRFRCDLGGLLASLHWLCDSLVSLRFSLSALPCLTFYQYLATFVSRDVQKSVQCRCLKLSALTDLRMFKEATTEALNLLYGVRLPHQSDVAFMCPELAVPSVNFNTMKSMEDQENLRAMEVLASKRISTQLSSLYGPHLTCEVTLGQARLLTRVAGCISRIPQKPSQKDLQFVSPDFEKETSRQKAPATGKQGRAAAHQSDDARSNISAFSVASASRYVNKLFTKRDRPVGLQLLKGMLLSVAEHLTGVMTKAFESSEDNLLPSELYLLTTGYCLLSEVYEQRQLSSVSAAVALSALKRLQSCPLFDDKPDISSRKLRSALRKKKQDADRASREASTAQPTATEPNQVLEQLYRARLNARLWLDCRLRMCQALATQVKGLGKVGSGTPDSTGALDHSQAQLYCAEGLAEAEACDDVEMQALFLIQGSSLDGISIEESLHMLEDASSSLDDQAELSNRALLGLVQCTTRFADLSLISGSASASESVLSYKSAHSVLLLKAMQEGEKIEHRDAGGELSTVSSPPRNLFSSYPSLLSKIKLRIAHAMLQTVPADSVGDEHQVAAELLGQARSLCVPNITGESQLLVEILVQLGKVQRMLVRGSSTTGVNQSKAALSSLREAVKLTESLGSDLSALRQAHIESAIVDLVTLEVKFSEEGQPPTELDRASSSPSVSAGAPVPPNPAQRSFSLDVGVLSQPLEMTQAQQRVAAALSAAFYAAKGSQQRAVLPGNPMVTSLTFTAEDRAALPDFVVLDLTTDHSTLDMTSLGGNDVSVDSLLSDVKARAGELTWIHVLMYNVLLQRKARLSTLVASGGGGFEEDLQMGSDESYGEDMFESGGRATTVRFPLDSGTSLLRITALHDYLYSRLSAYAGTCHLPPATARHKASGLAVQWHREPGARHAAILWCAFRADHGAKADCARGEVPVRLLESVIEQVTSLKKRTEEYFGRVAAAAESTQKAARRRSQQRPLATAPAIDAQLEEDWKHVLNQIANLLSTPDEPIAQMPFDINMDSAQALSDLFSVGCWMEAGYPMYTWLLRLLCPV